MNRIEKAFSKDRAFIAYLTAGHSGEIDTFESALALIEGGVDLLEIGVPFSDPVADGPVIQEAMVQSLLKGTNIFDVLALIRRIRQVSDVPIVLFSYLNPVLQAQEKGFFQIAKQVGLDGILIVDLPLEESSQFTKNCKEANISPIFIVTPSTPKERIKRIVQEAVGFIYYVCRKGTTGMRKRLPQGFAEKIREIKEYTMLPVVAGFGISDRQDAAEVIEHADGFVVGSFFVNAVAEGASFERLKQLAAQLDPRREMFMNGTQGLEEQVVVMIYKE